MEKLQFRGKNDHTGEWVYGFFVHHDNYPQIWKIDNMEKGSFPVSIDYETIGQNIGIKDKKDKNYFIGDIAKFDNGDTFVLKMEDYLEVYCEWIGDYECEDQVRDLYRISNAEIIGNIHENTELL